jgi:ABC-type multidrug transport system ATPase subunit
VTERLAVSNLAKQYGRVRAVRDVSLHVEPGEIV